MFNKFVIFISGPTCVGKTDLSISLFNYFPMEVINMDSSMIYRFMDIGTGKPSLHIRRNFIHHLFDIKDPLDMYSVWTFCLDSFCKILECISRNKIPFLVGGTMMYMWYFQNFFNFFRSNFIFLRKKNKIFKFNNYEKFNNILNIFNNLYRDSFNCFDFNIFSIKFINIFLIPFNKNLFYKDIKIRLLNMLNSGFIDEVKFLFYNKKLDSKSTSFKSIGYKDLLLYLNNKISFQDAFNNILNSTIELANKQLKWIKKWKDNIYYMENKKNQLIKKSVNVINNHLY